MPAVGTLRGSTPAVKSHSNGRLLNGVQFMNQLGEMQRMGLVETIMNNPRLDTATNGGREELPKGAQRLLKRHKVRSRTIGGKPEDGREPRRIGGFYVFVSKDMGHLVEAAVPVEALERFRGDIRNRGVFWDVTSTNTSITAHSDRSITAELLDPRDAVALHLVPRGEVGMANGSTLWIPTAEPLGSSHSEARINQMPRGEAAGAVARSQGILSRFNSGQKVYLIRPNTRSGVLVSEQDLVPVELRQLVRDIDGITRKLPRRITKADIRTVLRASNELLALANRLVDESERNERVPSLAERAQDSVSHLQRMVKADLLQPIIELIEAVRNH